MPLTANECNRLRKAAERCLECQKQAAQDNDTEEACFWFGKREGIKLALDKLA